MDEEDYGLEMPEKKPVMFPCVECGDREGYIWSNDFPTLLCKYHAQDEGLIPIESE